MPKVIEQAAARIEQQTSRQGHHAALFMFGPMPALIGLGALLGNKNHYIPMLRYRESGNWAWPLEKPVDNFYEIDGLDSITKSKEFVLTISFTAEVPKLLNKASELGKTKEAQIIEIRALSKFMGNGAIPHPENGKKFCADLQQLLHDLKSKYEAKKSTY